MTKYRTSISINEKLYNDAQPLIPLRYCTNFSEYVEDLIKEDVKAERERRRILAPGQRAAEDDLRKADAAITKPPVKKRGR